MQKCHNGLKKGYNMIQEDESMEISRRQSKINRDERLASERGMIRLFTPTEEDILRKGLKDGEVKEEN